MDSNYYEYQRSATSGSLEKCNSMGTSAVMEIFSVRVPLTMLPITCKQTYHMQANPMGFGGCIDFWSPESTKQGRALHSALLFLTMNEGLQRLWFLGHSGHFLEDIVLWIIYMISCHATASCICRGCDLLFFFAFYFLVFAPKERNWCLMHV